MIKTMRIAFALKNAYRVNGVLYFLRQLPIIGKRLPDTLYQIQWIKILAQVAAAFWELFSAFLGKFLFICVMVFLPAVFYDKVSAGWVFVHLFVLLTLSGRDNCNLTDTNNHTYYAVLLLGMDAKRYSLVRFGYSMAKLLIGEMLFGLLFGLLCGAPWWMCLLMPLFAVGVKCANAARTLHSFDKSGTVKAKKPEQILATVLSILLFVAAYGLPLLGITLPLPVCGGILALGIAAGIPGLRGILRFNAYRAMHQQLWADFQEAIQRGKNVTLDASRKNISEDGNIKSTCRGFASLNELFVKRHRKVIWRPAWIAAVIALAVLAMALLGCMNPEIKREINKNLIEVLPYCAFVLYLINRGASFTQALYMNCDHSLLTYSFYKRPAMILKLFRIRLWQIIRVNLLPGGVIALGLPLVLLVSGGTENPWDYAVLFASTTCMSVFFSTNYLTVYYLLQPYNTASELKNGGYQLVNILTYYFCYILTYVETSVLLFGGLCIAFCVIYCTAACTAVYFLAPKTFRIRQ